MEAEDKMKIKFPKTIYLGDNSWVGIEGEEEKMRIEITKTPMRQ